MGDKPPANPDDLTAAAKTFYAAAEELQRIHDVLTNRTQDLVSGSDAWAGSGSDQFQSAWERFGSDTLGAATTLERSANALNALAIAIQNVQASPAGKLARAIDAGHVRVVPDQVSILIPGASVIHASEAASVQTTVSNGYNQAAATGASGFDGAAHATASGAHLTGGVGSDAVGIAQAGWSAATQAAAGQSASAAGYAQTTTSHDETHAGQSDRRDDAAPVAPGFFTSASTGDGTESGATGFASNAGADSTGDSAAETSATWDGKAKGQARTRTYSRADLGSSPSDAALSAARKHGSATTSALA